MYQFVSPATEPVGALWSLMVLGLLWLLFRKQWRSAFWLGLPTFALFVMGSTPLTEILVAREERQWAAPADGRQTTDDGRQRSEEGRQTTAIGNTEAPDTDSAFRPPSSVLRPPPSAALRADAVISLGGGERISQHDLLGFAMSDAASRNIMAIELVRSGKAKTLVLGGSCDPLPGPPNVPSMQAVQDWVTNWGLVSGHGVTNLGMCRNTHDEALAARQLMQSQGWSKVILVTSALHLRRGVALFKKQGIEVTPVAADFHAWGGQPDPFSPIPRQSRLYLLTLYMHEKIGWWVYRARGWI